jgi:hypothetical protein
VLSVQAHRVLLERTPPRHRHGQHQCVERRVIEPLFNELPGRQQHMW